MKYLSCAFIYTFGIIALNGCGSQSESRSPTVVSQNNRVYSTHLSDAQLSTKGYKVLYRFQSNQNLVLLNQTNENEFLKPIASEFALLDGLAVAKKTYSFSKTEKKNQIEENDNPYLDGKFDKAFDALHSAQVTLNKVPIAIIDSGVRASTAAIQQILASRTNLTPNSEEDTWQSHATAIASIFGGVVDPLFKNAKPENVYAPNANIYSIKIAFSSINGAEPVLPNLGNYQLAAAIDTAIFKGAKIVNMSFTYDESMDADVLLTEKTLIAGAQSKGVVFVAAAGNSNDDLDKKVVYPIRHDLENIVVVGSHTAQHSKASSSSYGNHVDLTALGERVLVNDGNGKRAYYSGTSFAAPMVCAAIALYWGVLPQANYQQVLHDLFDSAVYGYRFGDDDERVSRYGRLDAGELVKKALNKL